MNSTEKWHLLLSVLPLLLGNVLKDKGGYKFSRFLSSSNLNNKVDYDGPLIGKKKRKELKKNLNLVL